MRYVFFIGIPVVVLTSFLGVGAWQVWSQHRIVANAQRVPATVLAKSVKSHTSRDSDGHHHTSYTPIVEYRCDFDGGAVVSDNVHPLKIGRGDRKWANRIVRQFKIGTVVNAYFNPANPEETFLIREISILPYLFLLIPLVIGSVLLGFVHSKFIQPGNTRKSASHVTVLMSFLGVLVLGHYFRLAGPDTDDLAIPISCVYLALVAIPFATSLPPNGILGRLKSAITLSLILALIGLFAGIFGGVLVQVIGGIAGHKVGGPHWALYTVPACAALGFVLGLFASNGTDSIEETTE